MDKTEKIISELCNKGYSYSNICSYLSSNDFFTENGKPFTKSNIRYYIRKYNIEFQKYDYIDLNELYFKKDRYYYLLNKYFKPSNYKSQLLNMQNMAEKVENTKYVLTKSDYKKNLNNYYAIIEKLKNKEEFKIYNKRVKGDYPGRELLAAGFDYKSRHHVLLKNKIFEWMKKNDQFILYSKNNEISLRGMISNQRIFLSFDENLPFENFLKYIYIPKASDDNLISEEVCSEDNFKIAIKKNNVFRIVEIRIKGKYKLPQYTLFEEELNNKIKSSSGVRPLTYSDINYVSQMYESLIRGKDKFKNVDYNIFFV